MGCRKILAWCLLGSLLGSLGLAALGWGVGTMYVLYGHRPPGEMKTMPEFGRGMMTLEGALLGLVVGPAAAVFGLSWFSRGDRAGKAR